METFDIIAGAILLLFLILGLKNGLVIELASLLGIVLAIILASRYSGSLAGWLQGLVTHEVAPAVAFVLLFVVVLLLVHLVARLIDKMLESMALNWVNRILGGAFGVLKGAFLISTVLFLLEAAGIADNVIAASTREGAMLYKPLIKFAPATLNLLQVPLDLFKVTA